MNEINFENTFLRLIGVKANICVANYYQTDPFVVGLGPASYGGYHRSKIFRRKPIIGVMGGGWSY